ncbi:hypothetical protein NQZ79_g2973 [Umbelopsis isabellina]|nr:hypothetical protein NQZ79_g2973 [Umbelopsis isabellina]
MPYTSIRGTPQLPTEIIILIITYLPTAKAFSNSRQLSQQYNSLCLSHSVQRQWLLNLPLSPDVIIYANKLRIGLPFTHARLAMEAGVSRHKIHNISMMSEIYLEKALPSFLYNISVLSEPSKDDVEFLDNTYKQYFIFRQADKRTNSFIFNWIAQTFGQSNDIGGLVRIWAAQAFDITICEYYQAIAKSISLRPSHQHFNALAV